jgi:hypothetical protein
LKDQGVDVKILKDILRKLFGGVLTGMIWLRKRAFGWLFRKE